MALITWLTDFGTSDPYVAEMKAAALCVDERVRFVDLSHGVSPGAIRTAAWMLAKAFDLFPIGTCHVAVVDPGVGTDRRGLAASAGGHLFVGPDNGVLAPALAVAGEAEIREITVRDVDRPRRGTTFDGRDVFAPVAARLVVGGSIHEIGPEVHDVVTLPPFLPSRSADGWEVEIVRADRYGNLVTTAEESFLRHEWGEDWRGVRADAPNLSVEGVRLAYADVPVGQPLLTIGGAGTLEISLREGSAEHRFGLGVGDRVRLRGPSGVEG